MAAAIHHGLTAPTGATTLVKGGWLGTVIHYYPSQMAQNFWTAIFAWSLCFIVTIVLSLLTRQRKTDEELTGLVYSLTPRPKEHDRKWYQRPAILAVGVLIITIVLNIIFW
jgi:SSS family solute:Na+ symporter